MDMEYGYGIWIWKHTIEDIKRLAAEMMMTFIKHIEYVQNTKYKNW